MAKWSVSLFGFQTGVARRAQPGDIISGRPFADAHKWTTHERHWFLIVAIDGITRSQMEAMGEVEQDLDSYAEYNPLSYDDWSALYYPDMSLEDKARKYITYTDHLEYHASIPGQLWRKRRFNFPLVDLEAKGVDTVRMLDKKDKYVPNVEFNSTEAYDKLRQRYVLVGDELNHKRPRTMEEIIENKSADDILAELRA